jgi:hypothetical protein
MNDCRWTNMLPYWEDAGKASVYANIHYALQHVTVS